METNVRKIEIWEADTEWYWHAKAGNGEIVVVGEGHETYENAHRAAEGVFPGVEIEKLVPGKTS